MSRTVEIALPRTITPSRAPTGELEHLVQLYETEDFLCDVVADFLAEGFDRGEPLVVIASPPRWDAIATRLAARGCDVETARRIFAEAAR